MCVFFLFSPIRTMTEVRQENLIVEIKSASLDLITLLFVLSGEEDGPLPCILLNPI